MDCGHAFPAHLLTMNDHPRESFGGTRPFLAVILDRHAVERSTNIIWSVSRYPGTAEGEVFFVKEDCLRLREEPDFDEGIIPASGYEKMDSGFKSRMPSVGLTPS